MTQSTGTPSTGTQATGTPPAARAGTGPVVLGVSVVGDEIASVVTRSAGGGDEIAASNLVDLPDHLPESAAAAITELVESVPFEVDHLVVSCTRPSTRDYLAQTFTPGPSTPAWYQSTSVDDISTAMVAVALRSPGGAGATAVVNLARPGQPADGVCVALVDHTTGQLLDTRDNSTTQGIPVTDPQGADEFARLILSADGGSRLSSVVCVGAGAELPGVAPALEYALARPVSIAEMPALALAAGAAATPAATTVMPASESVAGGYTAAPIRAPRDATGLRWWALGAVIGVAVLLGAIGLTALHASGDDNSATSDSPASTVTVTDTPQRATVTRQDDAVTETETETRREVRTTTVTPPTVTRTTEAPAATQTETQTVTDTATVTTTVTVTEQSGGGEGGQGGEGTGG